MNTKDNKLYRNADGRWMTKEEINTGLDRAKDEPEYCIAKALWDEVFKHPRKYKNVISKEGEH